MFNSMLFQANEKGQGLVEYALIIALIAVVIALFLPGVTDAIQAVFQKIITGIHLDFKVPNSLPRIFRNGKMVNERHKPPLPALGKEKGLLFL